MSNRPGGISPGKHGGQGGSGPDSKQRSVSTRSKSVNNEAVTLEAIMAKLDSMEKKQESMKKTFESKIDKLRTDLMASIDQKIKAVKDELTMDMFGVKNDYDELKQTVEAMKQRRDNAGMTDEQDGEPVDDIDKTLVMYNLTEDRDDSLTLYPKVLDMIKVMGEEVKDVRVIQCKRLRSHNNKPGIVKVAVDSKGSKIAVLKAKGKLKQSDKYKKVWVRSSKTHTERLIELNFKKMLQIIPGGENFRITASGRMKEKEENRREAGGDRRVNGELGAFGGAEDDTQQDGD